MGGGLAGVVGELFSVGSDGDEELVDAHAGVDRDFASEVLPDVAGFDGGGGMVGEELEEAWWVLVGKKVGRRGEGRLAFDAHCCGGCGECS